MKWKSMVFLCFLLQNIIKHLLVLVILLDIKMVQQLLCLAQLDL